MPPMQVALLAQTAATLAMVGLIWFVQVVHYPLLARVPPAAFAAYATEHQRRVTPVVAPLMVVEAVAALVGALGDDPALPAPWRWAGLGLVGVIWASTAWLQVPRHVRLTRGWDARAQAALVATNWLRTAAWTARGALVLAWNAHAAA